MLHIVPAQEGASEAPLNASIHVEILMRAFEELKLHLSTQLMTQLCGLDTHDLGIGATAVQAQNSATARGEAGHGGGDAAYAHGSTVSFTASFRSSSTTRSASPPPVSCMAPQKGSR